MPRLREVQDAQLLRAMTHPLRLRLFGALSKDGPATASELARRFGVSSGDTSYHLRALHRYGLIEEASELNHGRTKHWRVVDEGIEWSFDTDDPELVKAGSLLGGEVVSEYARWLLRWYAETPRWDRKWRAAAEGVDRWFELTPEELRSLADEVTAVFERYADRRTPRDGTERAIVLFHAFPERREAA
jgi:predicted ArsR family transcriptional regulator